MTSNRLPPLPDYVDVLGERFRVECVPAVDDEGSAGETVGLHKLIRVDATLDRARQWRVCIHEVCHAILHVVGADAVLSDEMNEVVAQSMEHGICQLLAQHGPSILAAVQVDHD